MTCSDRYDPHPTASGGGDRTATLGPARLGITLLGSVALLVGCSEPAGTANPAMTRDEFIDVVVAIRRVELDLEGTEEEGDTVTALFQARKDSILAAHGTTGDELYEFLERHTDLHYMDAVWDSITQRLKRPLRSRELPPEPEEDDAERQGWPPTRPDGDGRGTRLRPGG